MGEDEMSPGAAAVLTGSMILWAELVVFALWKASRTQVPRAQPVVAAQPQPRLVGPEWGAVPDVALRCGSCFETWIDHPEFQTCPECDVPTTRLDHQCPMDVGEAWSRKRHADFERFLERTGRQ